MLARRYRLAGTLLLLLVAELVGAPTSLGQPGAVPLPVWEARPGPYGGRVEALAAPASGAVAVASSPVSLYRTETGGAEWEAIDRPAAPWLFAAPDGGFWTPTPGLSSSDDGGLTWRDRSSGLPGGYVIALGGATGTPLYAALAAGLYRLDPGADAWAATGFDRAATAVAVGPEGTIYAGSDAFDLDDPNPYAVYRSVDEGATWTRVVLRADDLSFVSALAVVSDGSVYAGGWSFPKGYGQQGIFRSTDHGATWSTVSGIEVGAVEWIAPVRDAVYARTESVGSIRIVGEAWAPIGEFATSAAPGPNGDVLVGTYGLGVRRGGQAAPGGGPFVDATLGFGRAYVSRVAALPGGTVLAVPGLPYGSAAGLWRSTDDGATWIREPLPFVPDGAHGLFRSGDDGVLLAPRRSFVDGAFRGGGLYRTGDGGQTWEDVSPLDAAGQREPVLGVGAGPDGVLWAVGGIGFRRAFRSTDFGRTWERRADLLWSAMSFSVGSDGTLWVGEDQGGGRVVRSTDGAASWSVALPDAGVRVSAVLQTASGAVLASTLQPDYRSGDGGATWEQIDLALGEVWQDVEAFIEVAPGVVYGAVDATPYVVRSTDDGVTWEPAGVGLPDVTGYDSGLWLADDGHLWSAVPGGGVFRTSQPVTVASENTPRSEAALRLTVGPNPAGTTATVAVDALEPGEASVAVVDVLGRTVARVHTGPLAAGRRSFALDVSEWAAGVYVVRAQVTTPGGSVSVRTRMLTVTR